MACVLIVYAYVIFLCFKEVFHRNIFVFEVSTCFAVYSRNPHLILNFCDFTNNCLIQRYNMMPRTVVPEQLHDRLSRGSTAQFCKRRRIEKDSSTGLSELRFCVACSCEGIELSLAWHEE